MDNTKSQQDLINIAFTNLNSFKRHRALSKVHRKTKDHDKANYHELKMYENFDELELALRALQRGQRSIDSKEDNEE